ncbi:NAD(P)-dependent oxidoreductase [Geodermatophilus sp. URMC 60]
MTDPGVVQPSSSRPAPPGGAAAQPEPDAPRAARGASGPVVAVLGTGGMGAGMARSLVRAGLPVRLWNRDPAKARALSGPGAVVCDSPAEAVAGADVVLTMLFDAGAVEEVVRRAAPAPGTLWLQCSTVGLEDVDRLADLARELGLLLVDCPVQGTRKPAEEGQLVLLASGPDDARAGLAPVFEALGRTTLWLGEAGAGTRLKLVCNAWVLTLVAGTAQSVALARGLGLDPQDFFRVLDGGHLDVPFARVKGAAMIAGQYPVGFALTGALKDSGLILDALRTAGVSGGFADAVREALEAAVGRVPDPAAVDMAALVEGMAAGPG